MLPGLRLVRRPLHGEVGVRVECELDVLRMDRHEGQEDRADAILLAERWIAQAVRARENQEVLRVHRHDVLFEARERRLARVAAAAEIYGGEIEICAIAVLES